MTNTRQTRPAAPATPKVVNPAAQRTFAKPAEPVDIKTLVERHREGDQMFALPLDYEYPMVITDAVNYARNYGGNDIPRIPGFDTRYEVNAVPVAPSGEWRNEWDIVIDKISYVKRVQA